MMAIYIAELKTWRRKGAPVSCAIMIGLIGAVWLFSGAQLLFCLVAALGFVGWLAWQCAFDFWASTKAHDWRLHFGQSYSRIMVAKLLAFLTLSLLHIAIVLPFILQGIRLWGMPASAAWLALSIILLGGIVFFLICLFQLNSALSWRGVIIATIACAWLIPSLALNPFQAINPVLMLVGLFMEAPPDQTALGLGILAIMAIAAFGLNWGFLNRRGPEAKHGQ